MRRLLKKRGEGEEIALGGDRFGASLTIWQCTYSPSPLEKQTNLNVVTHTNISYQSWYWIGCNDYLVVVFASLKLTDNLINLIWIFKWFTTNQSVFLGVSFSEYYIDVKFHTDWRCSSNYREFGGKNQFHNYPNTGAGVNHRMRQIWLPWSLVWDNQGRQSLSDKQGCFNFLFENFRIQ